MVYFFVGGDKMTLQISIHDVGHGHAIHAFTPNGQTIVIDLGCSDAFSPLKNLSYSTKTIDKLIITHPHGDHIDEILELKQLGFNVRQLWRPKWLSEEDVRKSNQSDYKEKLDRYFEMSDKTFTEPIKDEELVGNPTVSGGVSINTFFSSSCGSTNINNHSAVVVFEHHGLKVVIPGDNESASWGALLKNDEFVDAVTGADIFMASHHGRESGFSSELLKIVKPRLCVISDGRALDTDASQRYYHYSSGWDVHSRSGAASEKRYCVTTRSDGSIDIEIGKNSDNRFLSVTKN